MTIDGADEFDPDLNLIKGGGGAMLREKVVASASKQLAIVTDSSKQVPVLGRFPLPVEVIGFAEPLVAKKISDLGAIVARRCDSSGMAYMTDESHHILDCRFGEIPDPPALARALSDMPGVVEHGLFVDRGATCTQIGGASYENACPVSGTRRQPTGLRDQPGGGDDRGRCARRRGTWRAGFAPGSEIGRALHGRVEQHI